MVSKTKISRSGLSSIFFFWFEGIFCNNDTVGFTEVAFVIPVVVGKVKGDGTFSLLYSFLFFLQLSLSGPPTLSITAQETSLYSPPLSFLFILSYRYVPTGNVYWLLCEWEGVGKKSIASTLNSLQRRPTKAVIYNLWDPCVHKYEGSATPYRLWPMRRA